MTDTSRQNTWPVSPSRLKKGIYWQRAWTLVHGCTAVSDACANCWLMAMNRRFRREVDQPTFAEENLSLPCTLKKPGVFCVWSDLFHECVEKEDILKAFKIMVESRKHMYLTLTKRVERIREVLEYMQRRGVLDISAPPENIFLGATIESAGYVWRLKELVTSAPAFRKFLSVEPLLSPLKFGQYLREIEWLVVGAESGPGARPCQNRWVREVVDQAKQAGVRVFVKQLHGPGKKLIKLLEEFPEDLRLRELPEF